MGKASKLILFLMVALNACQSDRVEFGIPLQENLEELTSEVIFQSSRENTVATGSSELQDDTSYGFAYSATNVLDLDYSTSWCPTEENSPQILTLQFPESTELGTVGIVGGYARDEKIFFENNRLKTVEVWYDDLPEAVDELHFEDVYGMQFFDLTQEKAQTVRFRIMETYPGSKYTDTCVAEVDIWSEWVEQKDANAAYDYYLEYKEAFSALPVGIESIALGFFDDPQPYLDDCKLFDESKITSTTHASMGAEITDYFDAASNEFLYSYNQSHDFWGTHYDYMEPPGKVVVNIEMDAQAKEGDEIRIVWLEEGQMIAYEYYEVFACDDGLYISADAHFLDSKKSGDNQIQIYYKDRLIGEVDYSLNAQ